MKILTTAFMWILSLGLLIGIVYGTVEVVELVKDLVSQGWNWELLKENFRGISLAAIELAVVGQSYIVARQARV